MKTKSVYLAMILVLLMICSFGSAVSSLAQDQTTVDVQKQLNERQSGKDTVSADQSGSPEPQNPFEGKPVIGLTPQDPDRMISVARRFMTNRDFQSAADLLENVYAQSDLGPRKPMVENLLRTCYEQLKQYEKEELLLRRMVTENTNGDYRPKVWLAELLAKTSHTEEAEGLYDDVMAALADDDHAFPKQQTTLRSMVAVALDDKALEYIAQLRQQTGDPLLFANERGTVLEGRRQYANAAREYLPVLEQDSTNEATIAERKLLDLLEFEESSKDVEKLLLTMADSASGRRTLNLLVDFYLKVGKYPQAFSASLRREALAGNTGFGLLDYMRRCSEREAWTEVVRMGDTLLARGVHQKIQSEVTMTYGRALEELGRYQDAIAQYERLAASAPHGVVVGDALYHIGAVYADRLGDYATAQVYFDSVVTDYPHGFSYLSALTALPRCYLKQGNLKEAQEKYAELSTMDLTDDAEEEALYYEALVRFFRKQYDSAAVGLQKVIVEYPKGYYVNDAIGLLLVLKTAQQDDALLYDYSNAQLFAFRGMADSSRVMLEKLIDAANKSLADLALFKLSDLCLSQADSAGTIAAVDRLEKEYPESYYLPMGLKTKADLLVHTESGLTEAKQLYRLLLEQYGDYPFASEVRETLRQLETPPAS